MTDEIESDVRIPRAEQLLIDACANLAAERVLCTSQGWGQLAVATAQRLPAAHVACHFLDLHPCEQAQHIAGDAIERVEWLCSADLPPGPYDLALIPVSRFGEAELTRDILQDAYERLSEGGAMVAAVDNRDDKWLHAEVGKLFARVTREPQRMGVVYWGERRGPLKRRREFRCEFAFRDQGRLVKAVSRPGVFSHRQLDLGARALLETMEVRAGDRVLDMGCGSGVVGLAAALRAENVFVQGIDSNARAVDCMRQGAALNGIAVVETEREGDLRSDDVTRSGDRPQQTGDRPQPESPRPMSHGVYPRGPDETGRSSVQPMSSSKVRVLTNADGSVEEPRTYDLVIGNPPYYSHFQIADIFLQAARRALKPGGRVHIVTKKDDWHLARMPQLFTNVASHDVRGYKVVTAIAR